VQQIRPIYSASACSTTDISWLQSWKLKPEDEESWNVFLDKYIPIVQGRIAGYCLQTQDTDDLKQRIFEKILIHIRNVERPRLGSFRAWLRKVIDSSIYNWLLEAKRQRLIRLVADDVLLQVAELVSSDIGESHRMDLVKVAIAQAQFDLEPTTWEMFRLTKVEGKSAKAVAQQLGVSILTVYDACRRVRERLKTILNDLDEMNPG